MSFFHANQREALNQSLAEVQGQINVSFEFFPPRTSEMEQTLWKSIDRLRQSETEVCFGNLWRELWRARSHPQHHQRH